MRTHHVMMTSLAVVLFGVTWLGSNSVGAMTQEDVCYQDFDGNDPGTLFLRLNVKRHSRLTTRAEEKELGHPRQTTYSVIGKLIQAPNGDQFNMVSANGSVLVARGAGARMAVTLTSQVGFLPENGGVAFVECGSTDAQPTPDIWEVCEGVQIDDGALGVPLGPAELRRVDPLEETRCSLFRPFNQE